MYTTIIGIFYMFRYETNSSLKFLEHRSIIVCDSLTFLEHNSIIICNDSVEFELVSTLKINIPPVSN